jgi:TolB-like protein
MTPGHWQRLRAVIETALDAEADKREEVLAWECGDDRALLSEARAAVAALAPLVGRSARGTPFMTPQLWQCVRAAIETALDAEADERENVLARACGDDLDLLSEARSILRFAQDTGGFRDAIEPRAPLQGRTLGHYRIEEQLASGVMGDLFRARDLALGRDVALRVLPRRVLPRLREWLLREAEASARLQHPAIAAFYESGKDQDETFLAMEFVRGETLRSRLKRGALPLDEAIALAIWILGALCYAHAAGVLHSDIKPENVMVTGARSAKLLDFGIALGRVVPGTVGYMSPEQICGENLDQRSDLFQAGVVLYECLTGSPAFGGSSPRERLVAALTRDVDLSKILARGLPGALCPIVSRALARDRERRYPTAMAFIGDLIALEEGRVETEQSQVLAVVQFENLNKDPETDWLGAGIVETLALDLTRVAGLELVPPRRVAHALGALGTAPAGPTARDLDLGLALGCGWVLSGAYQTAGAAIRITSHLTDVSTGRLVASENLDGTLDGIFALQDQLARAVLARLRLDSATARP